MCRSPWVPLVAELCLYDLKLTKHHTHIKHTHQTHTSNTHITLNTNYEICALLPCSFQYHPPWFHYVPTITSGHHYCGLCRVQQWTQLRFASRWMWEFSGAGEGWPWCWHGTPVEDEWHAIPSNLMVLMGAAFHFGKGICGRWQRVEVKWDDCVDCGCFSTRQSKQDGETYTPPQSCLCCWWNCLLSWAKQQ